MIIAADNINPMNPIVADAMERLDPVPIQDLARRCEQKGVRYIDINPGYLSSRKEDRMSFLVESVQEVTSLQLILDSPNSRLLGKGLASCRETPVLNALTMEEYKIKEILPLAIEAKTDLVVLLLDENSMCPATLDGKVSLAMELWQWASSMGIDEDKLIFDPVMPNNSWPDALEQLRECVKAIRMLSSGAIFGKPVRTIFGISNLLSGQKYSGEIKPEETCLSILAGAGLDIALANVLKPELMNAFQLISRMT